MFAAPDPVPPAPAAIVVIDEHWAARTATPPVVKPDAAAPTTSALADPRITAGVAAVLAEAPQRDPAPNRQQGLQPSAYGTDTAAVAKFARGFSDARVPGCLSPSSGGLGLLAIPVIAIQALRGKCRMP